MELVSTLFPRYLSSGLPERVVFKAMSEGATATIDVVTDGAVFFSTKLSAFGYYLELADLREIVESYMEEEGARLANLVLRMAEPGGIYTSDPIEVIYSKVKIEKMDEFLKKSFLTSRTHFRISRKGKQLLHWFAEKDTPIESYVDVVTEGDDGKVNVSRLQQATLYVSSTDVWTEEIKVEDVQANYIDRVMAFTVHRGKQRSMTFYVDDELPNLTLIFRNAFGSDEIAEIHGVSTRKQEVDRSEAKVLHRSLQYDQSEEYTTEVETAALTYEESLWYQQLFASKKIAILRPQNTSQNILITESTSETSDGNDDTIHAKFTYKLVDDREAMDYNTPTQIFTEHYQAQFT